MNPNVLLAYLICVVATIALVGLCELFYHDDDHVTLAYAAITGLPGVVLGVAMLTRAVYMRTRICVLWIRRKLFA